MSNIYSAWIPSSSGEENDPSVRHRPGVHGAVEAVALLVHGLAWNGRHVRQAAHDGPSEVSSLTLSYYVFLS